MSIFYVLMFLWVSIIFLEKDLYVILDDRQEMVVNNANFFPLCFGVFMTPIPVDVIDRSEHWIIDDTSLKFNCDAASFIIDVDWIV